MNESPDSRFELIPMSATDKLREYYQNVLEMLSLDKLHYLSRMLGESKRQNKKGIEPPTINSTSTNLQRRYNQVYSFRLAHAAYGSFTFRNVSHNLSGIKENIRRNHTSHKTRRKVHE